MFPKASKYGARKTVVDGIKFHSQKEAQYYCSLKIMKRAGLVDKFEMQVPYLLQEGFYHKACSRKVMAITYKADFVVYYHDGHTEVIDVKGYKTDVYEIKKKLLLYRYPEMIFREV